MTEREVVAAALAAVAGALVAVAVPWWLVVGVVVAAALARRPQGWMVALALVASLWAARAEAGLALDRSGERSGIATLVGDPERVLGGVTAEVSLDGRRFRATASDAAAAALAPRSMGERVVVEGRATELRGPWAWRASRHVSGALEVRSVRPLDGGAWWWRGANGLRRLVERGLGSFDDDQRALFRGVVLGDDRDQSEVERHRFRAAGLSHLLAVSGQNVAFALAAAAPVLGRLSLRGRWVGSLVVLVAFALVTRAEPSVLRAAAMAAVVATATWWGRAASGARVLAIAVLGLVLVDPLLVWSVGFRLSVAATAALVVLARPLERALPDAGAATRGAAAGLAATVGTAPLLVPLSGSVPLVGLAANLVAVPVAGMLMVWGVVTAPLAGLVGEPVATALGWPSRAMVWWLAAVARTATELGAGWVGALGVAGLVAAAVGLALRTSGWTSTWATRGTRLAVVGIVALVADVVVGVPQGRVAAERGVTVWRAGGAVAVVLEATATERAALRTLPRGRIGRVDLVVVTGGGLRTSGAVHALRQVVDVGTVVAARPETVRDSAALAPGPLVVGALRLEVRRSGEADRPRWSVRGPV